MGGSKTLLWTNPNITEGSGYNPNVTFAAQAISAVTNTMDYDYFIVEIILHGFRFYLNEIIFFKDTNSDYGKSVMINPICPSPNGFRFARRNMGFNVTNGNLYISNAGYMDTYGSSSLVDDNHFLIPYKIYGVKL